MGNALIVQPRNLILPRRGFRKPARPVLDPNDPINRGLTGYWLLGQGAGVAPDISLSGNNATYTNCAVAASSHGGTATSFNGSTSFVRSKGNVGIAFNKPFTLGLWCKSSSNSGTTNLAGTAINSGAFDGLWFAWHDTHGVGNVDFILFSTVTSGPAIDLSSQPSLNAWHYVVIAYTGSGVTSGMAIYVDGVLAASSGWSGTPLTAFTDRPLTIGGDASGTSNFSGSIENVRLYNNRRLSATEIARLYAEPYAGIYEAAPRWRVGSAAAPATFNPGWATGATRTIGGVF